MPYVDVWVDDSGCSRKQTAALKVLINICREISGSGVLPTFDADALDKALVNLVKEFPETEELHTNAELPADMKYREWLDAREPDA